MPLRFLPVLALLACTPTRSDDPSDSDADGSTALVDADAWTPVQADHDPLSDHRPSVVTCGRSALYAEGSGIEVDTGLCDYLAVSQPILTPISGGEGLYLYLFHNALSAPAPATAHAAVLLDGVVVWEVEVPIPADAAPFEAWVAAPAGGWPAGTPLQLHLHNHGANTWTWLTLEASPPR